VGVKETFLNGPYCLKERVSCGTTVDKRAEHYELVKTFDVGIELLPHTKLVSGVSLCIEGSREEGGHAAITEVI